MKYWKRYSLKKYISIELVDSLNRSQMQNISFFISYHSVSIVVVTFMVSEGEKSIVSCKKITLPTTPPSAKIQPAHYHISKLNA